MANRTAGVDVFAFVGEDSGASLRKVLDFVLPYLPPDGEPFLMMKRRRLIMESIFSSFGSLPVCGIMRPTNDSFHKSWGSRITPRASSISSGRGCLRSESPQTSQPETGYCCSGRVVVDSGRPQSGVCCCCCLSRMVTHVVPHVATWLEWRWSHTLV